MTGDLVESWIMGLLVDSFGMIAISDCDFICGDGRGWIMNCFTVVEIG